MRALRWTGRRAVAAVVGGLVAGAAAGVAARLVMWGIRLANPSYNGAVTHEGVVNGRWTWSGTSNVVGQAMLLGVLGGVAYLFMRPLLRGNDVVRGVEYGVVVFAFGAGVALDGSYEYVRFVSTWIPVVAFAALYPLYGLILGVVAGRIAPAPRHHRWPRLTGAASAVFAAFVAFQALAIVADLRTTYFT